MFFKKLKRKKLRLTKIKYTKRIKKRKSKSYKRLKVIINIILFSIFLFVNFIQDYNILDNFINSRRYFDNNLTAEYIYNNYEHNYTKEELMPYLKYMELSRKNILINKKRFKASNNPKVSVVISLYNREKYIKYAIRSTQNQNLTDIEIIVVDDFSTDNSKNIVKNYMKKDPRIVLLENKENRGALYSKSIGVLHAKGEYINSLDSDDLFCNRYYLFIAYNEAKKNNYDFIKTQGLYIDEIKRQILIRYSFWSVIWSKFIKKEVYLKAIFKMEKRILDLGISVLDDDLISVYLFIYKKGLSSKIVGISQISHSSDHVFTNWLKNRNSTDRYCRNFMKTIKGFYLRRDFGGISTGKFYYNGYYLHGPCKYLLNLPEAKELNMSDDQLKQKYHAKK